MRPIILSGHQRPLTRLKFNRDGDLLFSAAKDTRFNVWSSVNGELLGTYEGHSGVVWDFDIDPDSTLALTGSADATSILWNVATGAPLYKWTWKSPVRSVAFSPNDADMALIVTDAKLGESCTVNIVPISPNISELSETTLSILLPDKTLGAATVARWGPSGTIYMGHETGYVSAWEALSGRFIGGKELHKGYVTDLQFSYDLSYFVTSSKDCTAKLASLDLEEIQTYTTERPVYSAALSPRKHHVILGGGQEASRVTTSLGSGQFESRFFHKILGQEFARIKGHAGPINTIAVHPEGKGFASGGEEGRIFLYHFDKEYFDFKLDARDL